MVFRNQQPFNTVRKCSELVLFGTKVMKGKHGSQLVFKNTETRHWRIRDDMQMCEEFKFNHFNFYIYSLFTTYLKVWRKNEYFPHD